MNKVTKAREDDWASQIDDANLHIVPCDVAQVNSVYGECSSAGHDERDIRKAILSPRKNAHGVCRDRAIAFEVVKKLLPHTTSSFGGVFRIANAESLGILTSCLSSGNFSPFFRTTKSSPELTPWLVDQGFDLDLATKISDDLDCKTVEDFHDFDEDDLTTEMNFLTKHKKKKVRC